MRQDINNSGRRARRHSRRIAMDRGIVTPKAKPWAGVWEDLGYQHSRMQKLEQETSLFTIEAVGRPLSTVYLLLDVGSGTWDVEGYAGATGVWTNRGNLYSGSGRTGQLWTSQIGEHFQANLAQITPSGVASGHKGFAFVWAIGQSQFSALGTPVSSDGHRGSLKIVRWSWTGGVDDAPVISGWMDRELRVEAHMDFPGNEWISMWLMQGDQDDAVDAGGDGLFSFSPTTPGLKLSGFLEWSGMPPEVHAIPGLTYTSIDFYGPVRANDGGDELFRRGIIPTYHPNTKWVPADDEIITVDGHEFFWTGESWRAYDPAE